jgi:dTDP-4-amino-4,6-dideoxygalactose transaminase
LEAATQIQEQRSRVWHMYDTALRDWAREHEVRTPFVPSVCEQAYHMYYLLMPSLDVRTRFISFLKSRGIMAVFHYLPLNLSDMGLRFGGYAGQCPVTEDLSDRLVRLPFYNSLLESEQCDVIESIRQFDGWLG